MKGRKPMAAETHLLEKQKVYGDLLERIKSQPTALRELEPVCPQWFRASLKESWEYLAEILKNRGIFLDINGPLLEIAAIYRADLMNLDATLGRTKDPETKDEISKKRDRAAPILIKVLCELNISTTGMARLGSLIVKGKKKEKEEFFED